MLRAERIYYIICVYFVKGSEKVPIYVVSEQVGLDNYWIGDILAGIKKEADKKNLHVENFPLNMISGTESPVVLVVGYSHFWLSSICRRVSECGARPILVNAPTDAVKECAVGSVSFDYSGAVQEMLSYLAQCGKRRVAFMGVKGNRLSFSCKKEAFNLVSSRHYFESADVYECSELQNIGDVLMAQNTFYDAVICSRDVEAGVLIKQLKRIGISLPQDVFIASFGNSALSKIISPSLTTVSVDYHTLGEEAVRLSRYLSQNRPEVLINSKVRCPLIIRESTDGIDFERNSEVLPQKPISNNSDLEYAMFLQAEHLVRNWDSVDRNIVSALMEGKNTAAVAEKLFISQSSVKYRLKKMLTGAKIKDKSQLISIVARYGLL